MYYKIILLLLLSLCVGCKTTQLASFSDLEQIRANMKKQETAWNQGSIDGFMAYYWNSSDLSFVGSKGITEGWQQTLDNYKQGYPDLDAMGKLEFEVLELKPLGQEAAYMIGKYTLYRTTDQPSGYFTLIWEKKNGQWVITSDHTGG